MKGLHTWRVPGYVSTSKPNYLYKKTSTIHCDIIFIHYDYTKVYCRLVSMQIIYNKVDFNSMCPALLIKHKGSHLLVFKQNSCKLLNKILENN